MTLDTIAAIATPAGMGGVGIIRISGLEALDIAHRLAPGLPAGIQSHRLILCDLVAPGEGGFLDQALLVVMRRPRSYTGEDVVELHCHGGPVHLEEVLSAVFRLGARFAEPGEFTKRAFLNGRLDLVQAEAISDLVHAKSSMACRLARHHLQGWLSREIESLRERLAQALMLVEASIDFSLEEHVYSVDRTQLASTLEQISHEVETLLRSYDRGRKMREGIRCVITGRPNSGKSTLLNLLLECDRAITSPTPGTTRDYLDAELIFEGHLFWLVDTAGLCRSHDPIEVEGVRRARQQLDEADLILFVADSSQVWGPDDQALLESLTAPGIFIWNKIDLAPACSTPVLPKTWHDPVRLQLTSPTSLEAMHQALKRATRETGLLPSTESATICRARHREALQRAQAALAASIASAMGGLGEELIALDIRLALDAIGEIVGRITPEDILNRIFDRFCIGK